MNTSNGAPASLLSRLGLFTFAAILAIAGTAMAQGPGKIAYVADGEVWLMEADGTGKESLGLAGTDFYAYEVELGPGGTWVAFNGIDYNSGDSGLWIMRAETFRDPDNLPELVGPDASLFKRSSWHPAGGWLAYVGSGNKVYLVEALDADGELNVGVPETVTVDPPAGPQFFVWVTDVAFAPDGQNLLVTQFDASFGLLQVFDANGNRTANVIETPLTPITDAFVGNAKWPSFSPDGKKIVFQHWKNDTAPPFAVSSAVAVLTIRDGSGALTPEHHTTNPRTLYTVEGPTQPSVFSENFPSWSPDGTKIIFTDYATFPRIVSINASGAEHATNNPRVVLAGDVGVEVGFPSFAHPGVGIVPGNPAPVPPNLISWWPGENAAWDVAGIGEGSMKNSASEDPYDVGKVGRAFWFDGIDDHVQGSTDLSLPGDFTIEVWVQPTDHHHAESVIIAKGNDANSDISYSLLLRNGRPVFRASLGGIEHVIAPGNNNYSLPLNQWSHLAFTQSSEASRLTFYVNGVLMQQTAAVPPRPDTIGPLTIGAAIDATHPTATPRAPFEGLIDELSLYNRALSGTEIESIYAAGKAGKVRHDPARDFSATSNPNGSWRYGWVDGLGSPVPSRVTEGNPNLGGFLSPPAVLADSTYLYGNEFGAHLRFNPSKTDRAEFSKNSGTTTISLAPRQFAFQPAIGGDLDYTVLQWVAPEAGKYALSATFTGAESSPTSTEVFLYKNEAELFTGDVSSFLGDGISTTEELDLSENETVTWIVGGGTGAGLDYTGVVASAVKLDDFQPFKRPEFIGTGLSGFKPPLMNGKTVRFEARNDDRGIHPGMTAWIEYSATGKPGSWIELPNGGMTASGTYAFVTTLTELPVGAFSFRVATKVDGTGTTYSVPSDTFSVLSSGPYYDVELDAISDSDPNHPVSSDGDSTDLTNSTTYRSDTFSYRVRFRNSGGLAVPASDRVQILVRVPDGTTPTAGSSPGYEIVRSGVDTFAMWTVTRPLNPVDAKPTFTVSNATTDELSSTNHGLEDGDLVMVETNGTIPGGLDTYLVYKVISASSNTFKLALPNGTTPVDILNGGNPVHRVDRLWQTRTLRVAVADPVQKDEATNNEVDPGDVLQSFARITDKNFGLGGIRDSGIVETTLEIPLRLTAGAPIIPGGMPRIVVPGEEGNPDTYKYPIRQGDEFSVQFKVRNEASYATDGTFLRVQAPEGLTIRGGRFASGSNQPTPALTEDAQGAQILLFEIGSLAPGAERICEADYRVQYDWNVVANPGILYEFATASIARPALTTYRKERYTVKVWKNIKRGKKTIRKRVPQTRYRLVAENQVRNGVMRELEDPFDLVVLEALPGSPKPELQMRLTQHGFGQLPEDPKVQMTSHNTGLAPRDGFTIQHNQNQILYQVTFTNVGNEIAEFIRVAVPVPEHTTYAEGSAVVRHTAGEETPASAPLKIGNALVFNLPYLEKKGGTGDEKTLEFLVNVVPGTPVGTTITSYGGIISSRDLVKVTPVFNLLDAIVVVPGKMTYGNPLSESDQAGNHFHTIAFQNDGGINATGVVIAYDIPAGLTLQDIRYVTQDPVTNSWKILTGNSLPPTRSLGVFNPGATSGRVLFVVGTVPPGTSGYAQVYLTQNATTVQRTGPGAYDLVGPFKWSDDTTPAPSEPEASLAEEGPEEIDIEGLLSGVTLDSFDDPNRSRPYVMVQGPLAAVPGAELTYTITYGDHGSPGGDVGGGGVFAQIPPGTELVDYVVNRMLPNLFEVRPDVEEVFPGGSFTLPSGGIYEASDLGNTNGGVLWHSGFHSIPRNSAITVSMTIRVTTAPVNSEIKVDVTSFNAGILRRTSSFPTFIVDPNDSDENQQQRIYWSQLGHKAAETQGTADKPNPKFTTLRNEMGMGSRGVSIAGADYLQFGPLVVVTIGANNIVAAGGGNVVANDGAGLIGQDSAGIVAAGGGNIVAAGGGNLINFFVAGNRLTGTQLFADLPSIVAAGGGNIVAAGGGNLIRKAANLIGQDGASLIGQDGASLIGMDGASLIATVRGNFTTGPIKLITPAGAEFVLGGTAASIALSRVVANDGAGIVAAGGGNFTDLQGSNFINANNIVAGGGLNLIGKGGAGIVAGGGGNIVGGTTGILTRGTTN